VLGTSEKGSVKLTDPFEDFLWGFFCRAFKTALHNILQPFDPCKSVGYSRRTSRRNLAQSNRLNLLRILCYKPRMKFEKDRSDGFKIHRLLSVVLVLLICSGSMPAAETVGTGDKQYDRLMSQHPAPKLTGDAWQAILSGENGSRKEITSKLHVKVVEGRIRSVEVKQTSGFKFLDSELINWVQTQWHFRPNITDDLYLPIVIPLPPIVTVTTDAVRSAQPLVLHLVVDHGVIKKMDLLHSSGDRLVDNVAALWVKQHWLFAQDQSGEFQLPVVLKLRRR
jgi:hypothetical protein